MKFSTIVATLNSNLNSALALIFSALLTCALPANAFAHGEDKPGPHGGKIRMPGGFHTEVVAVSTTQLRVYLLDLKFSDPTVTDSSVSVSVNQAPVVQCQPYSDYFSCDVSELAPLDSVGELRVTAVRLKQAGAPAIYPLPLQ